MAEGFFDRDAACFTDANQYAPSSPDSRHPFQGELTWPGVFSAMLLQRVVWRSELDVMLRHSGCAFTCRHFQPVLDRPAVDRSRHCRIEITVK